MLDGHATRDLIALPRRRNVPVRVIRLSWLGGGGRPAARDLSGPYSSPLSARASITARRVGSSAFVSSSSVGMQVT